MQARESTLTLIPTVGKTSPEAQNRGTSGSTKQSISIFQKIQSCELDHVITFKPLIADVMLCLHHV